MLTENALDGAKMRPDDIDHVLLVGGSTRIPAVQAMLRRKFKRDPVAGLSVDEAVSLGAAIQAGIIMQEKGLLTLPAAAAQAVRRTRIQDVTNHSYGTLALSDAPGVAPQLTNSIIIPKNTRIPVTRSKIFYTMHHGQTVIDCTVTQGEEQDVRFLSEKDFRAKGTLELPPGRPPGCPIHVTYSYDENELMRCEFRDEETGRTKCFLVDLKDIAARRHRRSTRSSDLDDSDFDELLMS